MVSIIIPVLNPNEEFENLLTCLKQQTISNEIYIIDSSKICKTKERPGVKIKTIKQSEFDHGSTRNTGVKQCDSEFFIMLTQDVLPVDNNLIDELIRPLKQDPSIAVSFARQIPRSEADPIEKFIREFNYPHASMLKTKNDFARLGIRTFFCSNSCAAYRREIFDKLGGFEEKVGTNEDMLFAAKAIMADYGIYYCAEARIFHSHNYSLIALARRYFKIGKFFAQNNWLCEQVSVNGQGRQMVSEGLNHFWKNYEIKMILNFALQALFKAAGYSFGRLYGKMHHNSENLDFEGKVIRSGNIG